VSHTDSVPITGNTYGMFQIVNLWNRPCTILKRFTEQTLRARKCCAELSDLAPVRRWRSGLHSDNVLLPKKVSACALQFRPFFVK